MHSGRFSFLSVILAIAALLGALSAQAKPYKAAELITREEFKFGAFEARIRGAEGSGMITAFFLWKHDSERPGVPWQEQDFELFGKNGRFQTQAMMPGNPRTEHVTMHSLGSPIWENYFTYRMEWTPDYLAWYVDGHLVRMETDREVYAQMLETDLADPSQLRISLWAGDYPWSGELDLEKVPAATFVDHISVYNYTPDSGPDGSDFTLRWKDDFNNIDTNRWWFANWTFDPAVNDYSGSRNVASIDGKLVIVFTDENNMGQFPAVIPADNPPLPPAHNADFLPVHVPGRIEAEEASDYFDTTWGNSGDSECGTTNVDAGFIDGTDDQCAVGWTTAGEWTEYIVSAETGGDYFMDLRAATAIADRSVTVTVNGTVINDNVVIPRAGWSQFTHTVFPLPLHRGTNLVRIIHNTGDVNLDYFDIRTTEAPEVTPAGPVAVPGRVEVEAFTDYYDLTPGNLGNASCGTTDVDMQPTPDEGGGCSVGWTEAGEWLEYQVEAATAGAYELTLRAATAGNHRSVNVEVNGATAVSRLVIPNLGWQTYSDVRLPVTLEEGINTVRIVFETGRADLNYLVFDLLPPVEDTGPVLLPAKVEAEHYTDYYDTTPGNSGHAACSSTDVDAELTSDIGGGCNTGWTVAGEWLEYEVLVEADTEFTLSIRAATPITNRTLAVLVDGEQVASGIPVIADAWQVFNDHTLSLQLSEGQHTVRILFENGRVNLNYLEFIAE